MTVTANYSAETGYFPQNYAKVLKSLKTGLNAINLCQGNTQVRFLSFLNI